jgi:GT2 family glycosyltransferase
MRCLRALESQTATDFEVVVVDNSGKQVARQSSESARVRIIENARNVGFGAAINLGASESDAAYICTLNDDAYPSAEWLGALCDAAESEPGVGMCASLILLSNKENTVDSAGFGAYRDGTTKQIGHGESASKYQERCEALVPSGCAGLYRRSMLEEIGGFDDEYFLYGEDSDVGLRGRLAGWKCIFEPRATVVHDYSGSAGRASHLKAFYVERNRLCTLLKLFPMREILLSPLYSIRRYWAHWRAASRGEGLAGEFSDKQSSLHLVLIVFQAHLAAVVRIPRLLSLRRRFGSRRKMSHSEFLALLRRYALTASEIAGQ